MTARRLAPLWSTLLIVAATLATACGDDDPPIDPNIDASALLLAAADRLEQVERLHFVLEHENGSTRVFRDIRMTRAEGDIDGTERLAVQIDASLGPLNLDVRFVILEDQSWFTNPLTGRWEREDLSIPAIFDTTTGVAALLRSARDAEVTGSERIDGVDVYRVDAFVDSGDLTIFSPNAEPGRLLPATAWIGVDDPLVYRLEVTGPIALDEDEDSLRRLRLSNFDGDIEIVPPR